MNELHHICHKINPSAQELLRGLSADHSINTEVVSIAHQLSDDVQSTGTALCILGVNTIQNIALSVLTARSKTS